MSAPATHAAVRGSSSSAVSVTADRPAAEHRGAATRSPDGDARRRGRRWLDKIRRWVADHRHPRPAGAPPATGHAQIR